MQYEFQDLTEQLEIKGTARINDLAVVDLQPLLERHAELFAQHELLVWEAIERGRDVFMFEQLNAIEAIWQRNTIPSQPFYRSPHRVAFTSCVSHEGPRLAHDFPVIVALGANRRCVEHRRSPFKELRFGMRQPMTTQFRPQVGSESALLLFINGSSRNCTLAARSSGCPHEALALLGISLEENA